MSIARVKFSKFAARKGASLKCQRCGRDIAKGETYRWWFKGFRSKFKHVRCTTCPAPRPSELESSMKADAYAAIESAEDQLDGVGIDVTSDDLEALVAEAGDGIDEVARQYRDADESFGGGGATVSGEIADELESAAAELSQFSIQAQEPDHPVYCEAHEAENDLDRVDREECADCADATAEALAAWRDEMVDEARSALADASF